MFKCRACGVNQSDIEFQYYIGDSTRRNHVICYDCYICGNEKEGHETGSSYVKMLEDKMKQNKNDWYTGGDSDHVYKVRI